MFALARDFHDWCRCVSRCAPNRSNSPSKRSHARVRRAQASRPDGSEIAFVSGGDIWTVPAAGGEAQPAVSNAANDTRPVFSPDKTQARVRLDAHRRRRHLRAHARAPATCERVTFDDGIGSARRVVARRQVAVLFFERPRPLGRHERRLSRVGRRRHADGRSAAIATPTSSSRRPSPDGRMLAITARGIASGQWWRHGHSHLDEAEIWLRDLTAPDTPSAWRALTAGGAKDLWPMWAGDGTIALLRVGSQRRGEHLARRDDARRTAAADHAVQGRPRAVAVGHGPRATRSCSSATSGSGSSIRRRGHAAEVPITRMGAPAGPATEHLRLTNQFQDLALSPDGKKVAFAARGEIFAASAKDGGDAARVTHDAGRGVAGRLVPRQPAHRVCVGAIRSRATLHLRLRHEPRGAADDRRQQRWRFRAAVFARRRHGRVTCEAAPSCGVIDVASKRDRSLAKGLIADPLGSGRPIAWSPDGKLDRVFHGRHARLHERLGGPCRRRRRASQVSFFANGNATGVSWAPDGTFLLFDTSQRTENGAAGPRRSDPAGRPDSAKTSSRISSTRRMLRARHRNRIPRTTGVLDAPRRSRARQPAVGGEARSQTATQSRSRSFSTTSASGPPSCRPASTSERRSSARTARRSS